MRKFLIVAAGAALLTVPGIAMAQSGSTSEGAPKASDLKGPPNANGYGTDTGMEKGSTVVGGAGSSEDKAPSATNMHGSPNASGFKQQ